MKNRTFGWKGIRNEDYFISGEEDENGAGGGNADNAGFYGKYKRIDVLDRCV